MAVGKIGGLVGGGGSSGLNIFIQDSEPAEKKGFWINEVIIPAEEPKVEFFKSAPEDVYVKSYGSAPTYAPGYDVGDRVLFLTSLTSGSGRTSNIWAYDKVTFSITVEYTIPSYSYDGTTTHTVDKDLLILWNPSGLIAYDIKSKTSRLLNFPHNVYSVNGTLVRLGDKLYIISTRDGSGNYQRRIYEYDLTLNTWKLVGTPLYDVSALYSVQSTSDKNKLYVIYRTDIYLLDLPTGVSTLIGKLPATFSGFPLSNDKGNLLFVGQTSENSILVRKLCIFFKDDVSLVDTGIYLSNETSAYLNSDALKQLQYYYFQTTPSVRLRRSNIPRVSGDNIIYADTSYPVANATDIIVGNHQIEGSLMTNVNQLSYIKNKVVVNPTKYRLNVGGQYITYKGVLTNG